jgi:hypothetical protein
MIWEATNKGAGSGLIGKSWTHIIGGVLAVNIQLTISTVAATFYQALICRFWSLSVGGSMASLLGVANH